MKRTVVSVVCVALLASTAVGAETEPVSVTLEWGQLPDLPLPLSGTMAGVSGDALIVAGGANFPVSLFKGGKKVWYDTIYVLPSKTGSCASWYSASFSPSSGE